MTARGCVILSAAKDLSAHSSSRPDSRHLANLCNHQVAARQVREKSPLSIGLLPIHFFLYRRRLLSGRNAPQLPIQNKRSQHIHNHAGSKQSGHVGHIVRRRNLYNLHPCQSLPCHKLEQLEDLARQKPSWLWSARPWRKSRVKAVDIEAEKDALRLLPGNIKGILSHSLDTVVVNIFHRH